MATDGSNLLLGLLGGGLFGGEGGLALGDGGLHRAVGPAGWKRLANERAASEANKQVRKEGERGDGQGRKGREETSEARNGKEKGEASVARTEKTNLLFMEWLIFSLLVIWR